MKEAKDNKYLYRGAKITIVSNLLSETMKARIEWGEIIKVFREKNLLNLDFCTLLNCPLRGEIKTFSDKQTLR